MAPEYQGERQERIYRSAAFLLGRWPQLLATATSTTLLTIVMAAKTVLTRSFHAAPQANFGGWGRNTLRGKGLCGARTRRKNLAVGRISGLAHLAAPTVSANLLFLPPGAPR